MSSSDDLTERLRTDSKTTPSYYTRQLEAQAADRLELFQALETAVRSDEPNRNTYEANISRALDALTDEQQSSSDDLTERFPCGSCGMLCGPDEYHTFLHCLLVQSGHSKPEEALASYGYSSTQARSTE